MHKQPIVIAGILLILIIVIGLFRGVPQKEQKPVPPSPTLALAPYATTTLSLGNPVSTNGIYKLPVTIDASKNSITAVQMAISFDSKMLTNVDITPATFFTNRDVLLKKIDTEKGIIYLTLSTALGKKGPTGSGTVATISFQKTASAKGPVVLQFLPDTQVAAAGQAKSVLKQTFGTSF